MVKILEDKYPMGSFRGQKTPGRYIDGYLYDNIKLMARKIVDDMTFLGVIFSSTLEVGTGKSVLATQLGEAWVAAMREEHNIDLPYNMKNIVFRPKDLVERSFELPKYSFILLDEWEDAHYWSELGMTLRQFFRKCRQLNLFMVMIIPNFFQLNISYAVSRSAFAIDVRFEEGFQRGFYRFYDFDKKKDLYVLGKKTHNYNVTKASFYGRFTDGYGVDEEEYRRVKLEDMMTYQDSGSKASLYEVRVDMWQRIVGALPIKTQKELGEAVGISEATAKRWTAKVITNKMPPINPKEVSRVAYLRKRSKERIDAFRKEQQTEESEEKKSDGPINSEPDDVNEGNLSEQK